MPFPQSVKVGGLTLQVRVVQEIPVDGGNASGHWDYASGQLRISKARNPFPEQQQETMLHEVLHVIDESLELQLSEQQISALAHALHALLVDNPGLMETA